MSGADTPLDNRRLLLAIASIMTKPDLFTKDQVVQMLGLAGRERGIERTEKLSNLRRARLLSNAAETLRGYQEDLRNHQTAGGNG